jgi:hypothetical protein
VAGGCWCACSGGPPSLRPASGAGRGSYCGRVIGVTFLAFRTHLWRAECGGVRFTCMVLSGALSCRSQQVEQAGHKPADIGCQAGRGQVEARRHADNRLPDPQAGIPAQHDYRSCQQHGNRNRDRQTLTSPRSRGQDEITAAVVSRRRRPAVPCAVPSGHGRCISGTGRHHLWFVPGRHTTGRCGIRSGDTSISHLLTGADGSSFPWPGDHDSPGTIGTGEPLRSLTGRHRHCACGRP